MTASNETALITLQYRTTSDEGIREHQCIFEIPDPIDYTTFTFYGVPIDG